MVFIARVQFVLLLLVWGCKAPSARDDSGFDDPLVRALQSHDYATAELMLQRGYPVRGTSKLRNAPAFWAVSDGDSKALSILIRAGQDVNHDWGEQRGNLMTIAVQFGHMSIVQELFGAGASLDRKSEYGRSPLCAAIIYDQEEIKAFLISKGARLNERDVDVLKSLGIDVATPNTPNKSLQPTATAVTPPAAQEIVPAVAVAEH